MATFQVTVEITAYATTTVTADTPEEAAQMVNDNPNHYDYEIDHSDYVSDQIDSCSTTVVGITVDPDTTCYSCDTEFGDMTIPTKGKVKTRSVEVTDG